MGAATLSGGWGGGVDVDVPDDGAEHLDRHRRRVGLVGRRLGVVVVDGVGEGVVAGEVGGRVVGERAVGVEGDVVAAGAVGAADRRRAGGEPGGGVDVGVVGQDGAGHGEVGTGGGGADGEAGVGEGAVGVDERVVAGDGRVVDRGDGDAAGDDVGQVVGAGPVVDLEADGAGPGGGVLAGVGVADVTQRGLVVGDRAGAGERQGAGGRVEGVAVMPFCGLVPRLSTSCPAT